MNEKPSILAVVPARGGSKTIPRKNLALLNGLPLLAYPIRLGLESALVDRVILSTDDEEIAAAGKELGAEVPFMRPDDLAADDTPDRPVFRHVLEFLAEREGYKPDFVLNLRCTTPLKTVDDIREVVETWRKTGSDSVRTMTRVEGVFHPYWMYRHEGDLAKTFVEDLEIDKYYQRQTLPPVYRLNGLVDGIRADVILNHASFWGDEIAMVETPEIRSVDIDTELDLQMAELLVKRVFPG